MEDSEAAVECSIVGTMVYIAPEVLQGKYKLSADIYSLGVVGWMVVSYAVMDAYFHVTGSNRNDPWMAIA
jgi:serine/threonine protein kinase